MNSQPGQPVFDGNIDEQLTEKIIQHSRSAKSGLPNADSTAPRRPARKTNHSDAQTQSIVRPLLIALVLLLAGHLLLQKIALIKFPRPRFRKRSLERFRRIFRSRSNGLIR